MHCPNCGKKINHSAKFCYNCGTRCISKGQAHKKKAKKNLSFAIGALIILILILLAVLIKVSSDYFATRTHKNQIFTESKPLSLYTSAPTNIFIPINTPIITVEPTATPYVPTARDKTTDYFAIVLSAVKSDTSGTFNNITLGTDAYSAIVEIENLHEKNPSDPVIKQLYTCCEIISLVRVAESSGWSSYRDQAKVLSETLDPQYSGPYSEDITSIVIKLFGNTATPSNKTTKSNASSKKGYSTLTKTDKAKIIQYMEGRYAYYDNNPQKYSGSKTDQVWKDAMSKYSLSKAEVDLVWEDYDAWQLYWSW